ncbi:MAG: hypothetical protein AAFR96_10090 [Planctomycetota bacterium]
MPSRRSVSQLPGLAASDAGKQWNIYAVSFHRPADLVSDAQSLGLFDNPSVRVTRDNFGESFRAINAAGTPIAALFDDRGEAIALTHPSNITPAVLAGIHRGDPVDLPASTMTGSQIAADAWDVRLIEASGTEPPTSEMTRVDEPGNMATFDPDTGSILVPGQALKSLLSDSLGVPEGRIDWTEVDGEQDAFYRVKIVPADRSLATSKRLLAGMIRSEMGWSWEPTATTGQAWVITMDASGGPTPSQATEPSISYLAGTYDSVSTIRDLAAWLEGITRTPAIDQTETGDQLFDLSLAVRSVSDIETECARLGLRIKKEEASVPGLRVYPVGR